LSWYVVKTAPGAQLPQRQYQIETTRSAKGYRIVPSLDPNVSAIERALKENGFIFYMPAEKRLVRDRRRTDLWKVRRFALLVGYLFVKDPHDWLLLAQTPGVAGVLRSAEGAPLEVDLKDILLVRAAEAQAEVEFDQASRAARQKLRQKAKTEARLQALVEKLDIAGLVSLRGE
jgi:transcription antitermination factor NusG